MESLSGAGRRDAYKQVKLLCDLRLEGTHSEEEIAEKLKFGSLEAMHVQLENWGLSGLLMDTGGTVDTGDRRRKASSSGDVKALPTVAQAEPLFRADLTQPGLGRCETLLQQGPIHLQGKYRNPLPLTVLEFTNGSKFTKETRSWSGSTEDLIKGFSKSYPRPGYFGFPKIPPTPEDPESKEAERLFDETCDLLMNLWGPSDHRRFNGLMKTCAYIVREVGIKVSWRKMPKTVTDSKGVKRTSTMTYWTIEAPRWAR